MVVRGEANSARPAKPVRKKWMVGGGWWMVKRNTSSAPSTTHHPPSTFCWSVFFGGFDLAVNGRWVDDALPQFLAGTRQDRPDAVDRHVQFGGDFLVGAAFEVVEAHNLPLTGRQLPQQAGDFLQRFETNSRLRRLFRLRLDMTKGAVVGGLNLAGGSAAG